MKNLLEGPPYPKDYRGLGLRDFKNMEKDRRGNPVFMSIHEYKFTRHDSAYQSPPEPNKMQVELAGSHDEYEEEYRQIREALNAVTKHKTGSREYNEAMKAFQKFSCDLETKRAKRLA